MEVDPRYVRLDRPVTISSASPGYIISLNGEWSANRPGEGLCRTSEGHRGSPFMALVNIVQFDTMSRVLGWQSRYRWILEVARK